MHGRDQISWWYFLSSFRTMIYVFVCHCKCFILCFLRIVSFCRSSLFFMLFDFMFSDTYICVVFTIHHTQHKKHRKKLTFLRCNLFIFKFSNVTVSIHRVLENWIMFQYNNCRHLNIKNGISPIYASIMKFFIEARLLNIYVKQHNTCFYHFKKSMKSFLI